jgi:hypothetical protein
MHEERNAAYAQLESMPRWTAVDYGRPPKHANVLVTWDKTHIGRPMAGTVEVRGWYSVCGSLEWDDTGLPTHWMRMPEFKP